MTPEEEKKMLMKELETLREEMKAIEERLKGSEKAHDRDKTYKD